MQLFVPNNHFVSAETYNSLFTMHALTMIFGALMPLTAAFFNFIVPLQIGARDVAFPRLNAFSYWLFLFGSLFLNVGWLLARAGRGWFAYAQPHHRPYSPGLHMDFWVLGLQVLGVASLVAALNFLVTIVNLRAPGMADAHAHLHLDDADHDRPARAGLPGRSPSATLLMFDRSSAPTSSTPAAGGDPLLWQHLFWVFGHPEVYILIMPAMGIVSEMIPTFSRKPLFGYA